jgi:hypothetical protein
MEAEVDPRMCEGGLSDGVVYIDLKKVAVKNSTVGKLAVGNNAFENWPLKKMLLKNSRWRYSRLNCGGYRNNCLQS